MYGKASHFLKRLHNKANFKDCWKYNIYDTFKNYFLCECIANDWAFHFLVNSLKSISPKYMYMKHVWYVLGDPVTDQRWNICHVQLVKNSRYLSTSRICTLSCLLLIIWRMYSFAFVTGKREVHLFLSLLLCHQPWKYVIHYFDTNT